MNVKQGGLEKVHNFMDYIIVDFLVTLARISPVP